VPATAGTGPPACPSVALVAFPAPEPAPITTIAWRLAHLIVGVFGMRNAAHFGRPHTTYDDHEYAPTAHGLR
jgi:hypothetical protein